VIFNELATGEIDVVQDDGYSDPEEKQVSDVMKRAQEHMAEYASAAVPMQATKALALDEVTTDPSDIPDEITIDGTTYETVEVLSQSVFDLKEPSAEELGKEIHRKFPYIISIEEWSLTEQQYAKTTLTYYEGSKTLADDKESILPNLKYLIGEDAVNHFGHDDDNPQTVFVRNDKLKADFEVILDVRTYNEAVFGIDPEG
jgi:hypothetical protein